MQVIRIDYECLEDKRIPKYKITLESVPDSPHWYIKKVFVYKKNSWVPSPKYSHNTGMGTHEGIVKYSTVNVGEYFKMLVKYEGYSYLKD